MKPDVKTEQIVFRTTKKIRDFLDKTANDNDRSVSYVLNDLLGYFADNPPDSIPVKKKQS